MALTEQEKAWLETRKNLCKRCGRRKYCRTGNRHGFNAEICRHWELTAPNIPSWGSYRDDWKDAAEFEARVAARLSSLVYAEPWPNLWPECISCERHAKEGDAACPPCVLKEARLAVEAEMKKERTSCR